MQSPLEANHAHDVLDPDGSVESAIAILERLISFPSVSSSTNVEITNWCAAILSHLGFSFWRSEYDDDRGVRKANLVGVRRPPKSDEANSHAGETPDNASAGIAYFCHTDVVPAKKWVGAGGEAVQTRDGAPAGPFHAVVTDGRIYGRGACDMKGSFAAMLSAVARIDPQQQTAPIWLVCTADEEVGFGGAKHIVEHCEGYRQLVKADPIAIIGEPTELNVVHAHKGIRGFTIHSRGRAGHSATNQGINANEAMVPMLGTLLELCRRTREDERLQDDRFDPPLLSWNFGVSDHSDVVNITPERCDAWVSLRPMPEVNGDALIDEAKSMANRLGLSFRLIEGCDPLWTEPTGDAVCQFSAMTGTDPQTVSYSTDGGVLGELSQRIVIGPGSIDQAHTVDEWISIDQLRLGIEFYEKVLRRYCVL